MNKQNKKKDINSMIIKHRKKEVRSNFLKLPQVWWSISILAVAVIMLIVSRCTYVCDNWLSGALVSTSCGCFTGLVLYFLSNIRANKLARLQREYKAIDNVRRTLRSIFGYKQKYTCEQSLKMKSDLFQDIEDVVSLLRELEQERNELPFEVYHVLQKTGYDPMDYDSINAYVIKLHEATEETAKSAIIDICKELYIVDNELHKLHGEREDQLMLLGKWFV